MIGVSEEGKAALVVGVTDDLIGTYDAVALARVAVEVLGGKGGGGRPDLAQGGGPDGRPRGSRTRSHRGEARGLGHLLPPCGPTPLIPISPQSDTVFAFCFSVRSRECGCNPLALEPIWEVSDMRMIAVLAATIGMIIGSLMPASAAELKLCNDIKQDQERMACLQEHIVLLEGDIVRLEGNIAQLSIDLEQKLGAEATYRLVTATDGIALAARAKASRRSW